MAEFIPISQPSLTSKEIEYVNDAVMSGWVSSLGKYIDLFEKKFADYCGTSYALTTSSGTSALHLALLALNVKNGDEVIIPDLTFIATANAVSYTGATVVTVDIDENNYCICLEKLKAAITKKTKAIVPVHLYGHPANMSEIMALAEKYSIQVIEDAAEAHGAEIGGKKVGGFGDCAVFSFYGNKIITTGEGGMVTTNNRSLYDRMKILRDHAMDSEKRYWHNEIGYNYRMTNLQAALGLAQLERIDQLIMQRMEIFDCYYEELKNVDEIRIFNSEKWASNVHWIVGVEITRFNEKQRNELMNRLRAKNIDSRPFFYPISDMPMYANSVTPVAHRVSEKGICLPTYSGLTRQQIKQVCAELIGLIKC